MRSLSLNDSALRQLQVLIDKAGLWDIAPHKIFITWERREGAIIPVVRLVDIEMPGLGGASTETFFHQNKDELISNASVGQEGLAQLRKKHPSWLWRKRYLIAGTLTALLCCCLDRDEY